MFAFNNPVFKASSDAERVALENYLQAQKSVQLVTFEKLRAEVPILRALSDGALSQVLLESGVEVFQIRDEK